MTICETSEKINSFQTSNLPDLITCDAFGKSTNVKHDPTNKKQFTGKEVDEDSGLQYF